MLGEELLFSSQSAVLLIFFNRPDLVKVSLNNLINSKRNVYISIDGPRNTFDEPCVRECIALAETFSKEYSRGDAVKILIRELNLGCKEAVRSAIDWAFENEERLIILEDDISFKEEFLETMDNWLEKFDVAKEVFHLNGYNPLPRKMEVNFSYLCRYTHVWGWATWRDRWSFYDRDLETWDGGDLRLLPGLLGQDLSDDFCEYWNRQLLACSEGLDTWDIQWLYSQWRYGGFSLTPGARLTGNIGFDVRATHTKQSGDRSRERQPTAHYGQFMYPVNPKVNLELNLKHDLIEYGITGSKDFLNSHIWTLKTIIARRCLLLLRIRPFHQLAAALSTMLMVLPYKRVSVLNQKARMKFLRILRSALRVCKQLFWRIFRKL
jgi:GR25 family glycosyltransferase involved in LPS biosynthesis